MKSKEETMKALDDFKASLKGKTLEELKEIEQQVIKECDEVNERVAKFEYPLEEENYPAVAQAVRDFLNTQTVQWQYTLAMVSLYDFWNPEINKYFEPLTQGYTENTQEVYDAASKHNIVMDEMGLNTPGIKGE